MQRDAGPLNFPTSAREKGLVLVPAAKLSACSVPSSAELLRIAFNGAAEEWADLHQKCEDHGFAMAFVRTLAEAPIEHREQVEQWLEVLRDMHPDL